MGPDNLLFRQVHPSWIREGRITSQTFRPTPKDHGRLSVYDGDRVSPEVSYRHFTENLGLVSDGVVAVTVGECLREQLRVAPDPTPFPEHVVIDFRSYSNAESRVKARHLTIVAEKRGWQYGGPDEGP